MTQDAQLDPGREDLEAILHTSLRVGVKVHECGGYTARVMASMRRVALALGAERVEATLSSLQVGLTVHRGGWSRTAIRHAGPTVVNFSQLSELSRLSKSAHTMSLDEVNTMLDHISGKDKRYPAWMVLPMLGASCAAFSTVFGSDLGGIVLAGLGGFAGATARHVLTKARFKPFVFCAFAAFVSAMIVLVFSAHTGTLTEALAACVLFLVPGVPLLNGMTDLLTGYPLNSVVRLTLATTILLGGALGLVAAIRLWGISP